MNRRSNAVAFFACALALQCASAYDWASASGTVTVPPGGSYVVGDSDISSVNALQGVVVSGGDGETPPGELVFTCSSAPTVAISGAGRVVKRSNHNWTLSKSLDSFTGFYVLEGGITTTDLFGQFGSVNSSAGGVVVSNGATLFMTGSADRQDRKSTRLNSSH